MEIGVNSMNVNQVYKMKDITSEHSDSKSKSTPIGG